MMLSLLVGLTLSLTLIADCFGQQAFSAMGTWSSTWGPITLKDGGSNRDGSQAVTGYWQEKSGNRGVITRGGFTPHDGHLWFDYYQPWDGVKGTGQFELKKDGTMFDGTYRQTNGSGHWTLTRPIQESMVSSAPSFQNSYQSNYPVAGSGGGGKRGRGGGKRGAGRDKDRDGIPDKLELANNAYANPAPAWHSNQHQPAWNAGGGSVAGNSDISGLWDSNFGKVSLRRDGVRNDGTWKVSGSWNQSGKMGQIEKGRYNPNDGSLSMRYFMPWKNMTGEANLQLKKRGRTLEGTWQQADGSGTWTMTR